MSSERKRNKKPEELSTLYVNNYPASLCRERTGKNGSIFYSISFRKENIWMSFILPQSNVRKSRKRDYSLNEAYRTLLLGNSQDKRLISIPQEDNGYTECEMTNEEICKAISEAREAYAVTAIE